MSDLIKMIRDAAQFDGGPTEANVHPNEVTNYRNGGWYVVQAPVIAPATEQKSEGEQKPDPEGTGKAKPDK